jgi:Flp pilus assembly protein CpaB
MKKYIPLILAAAVFLLALVLLQPESKSQVVVLVNDLPSGHVVETADMAVREIPDSFKPSDAITTPTEAVGQTLKNDHSAGDILRKRHLGEPMTVRADEREVAIHVDDATGLGGLIAPGDVVGLTAVIFGNQAAYSKVTAEGFRVLYVSPEFRAGFTPMQSADLSGTTSSIAQQRSTEGIVLLAVPAALIDVKYDFTFIGGSITIQKVNAVELIAAITASGNAKVILYRLPKNPSEMQSPGLYLPDLIFIPSPTPAPTTTSTPSGILPTKTP